MIKPGDYVEPESIDSLWILENDYCITRNHFPALVIGISQDGDDIYIVSLDPDQGSLLDLNKVRYWREQYGDLFIDDIENIVPVYIRSVVSFRLKKVSPCTVFYPDGSFSDESIIRDFGVTLVKNNKKYIVAEISEDKNIVWVDLVEE